MDAKEFLKSKDIRADNWQYHGSEPFICRLMEEYAKLSTKEVSDEEMKETALDSNLGYSSTHYDSFIEGAKWMREQLKQK